MDDAEEPQHDAVAKSIEGPTKTFVHHVFAGGIAGCIAKTVIAPLDRAKINFQCVRSLWRGNTATLSRIFPYAAIQYTSHARYMSLLEIDGVNYVKLSNSQIRLRRFIAGVLTGMTSVTLTYPFDLARARMAVTTVEVYTSLPHAIQVINRTEGLRTLYQGFTPTMLGIVPYAGTAFFVFESLKAHCLEHHQSVTGIRPPKLQPGENLVCGAIAGLLGQTSSYPLDIVRRRMQTAGITDFRQSVEREKPLIGASNLFITSAILVDQIRVRNIAEQLDNNIPSWLPCLNP